MGWSQSPPYFCCFTETCTDIANATIASQSVLPPHPVEDQITPLPQPEQQVRHPAYHPGHAKLPSCPLAHVDIYIDDFLLAAQCSRTQHTLRAALHAISTVFIDDPNSPRRTVVSASKLAKGDATWSTKKRILGWDIDTSSLTIHVPEHRLQHLQAILAPLLHQTRVSRKKWQVLLGELRSMVPAIHSVKYHFSILQEALTDQRGQRIRLSKLVRTVLADWLNVTSALAATPAPITMLVPTAPMAIGATDACIDGMGGGFWLSTDLHQATFRPTIWRAPFPAPIQRQLVSFANLTGDVSNSDLELAGYLLGHTVLPTCGDQPTTVLCATDNTPTQAWVTRGSPTSTQAKAFLLHTLGCICRARNMSTVACFIPGLSNSLADFCSCAWHLSDNQLLAAVNCRFPVQPSWTLAHPEKDQLLKTISVLSRKLPLEASPPCAPTAPTQAGLSGNRSASPLLKTQPWLTLQTPSHSCGYSPTATELAPWLPPVLASALAQWRTPFEPWGRRSPHWAALAHACNRPEDWICAYTDFSKLTQRKMTHPHGSSQYHSPSSRMLSPSVSCNAPANISPSPTCSSLASSFCCARGNTQPVPTQIPRHSDFRTSTSTATNNALIMQQLPSITYKQQQRWPWSLPIKKTGSEVNSWGSDNRATRPCAQSSPSSTARYTSASTEPRPPHTSTNILMASVGPPSMLPVSPPLCAAQAIGNNFGIAPEDISARSLRSSGAMALLCATVDTDVIRLLGRWRSDEMMRYLHVQALPILAPLATQMVTHSAFTLLPHPPVQPLP